MEGCIHKTIHYRAYLQEMKNGMMFENLGKNGTKNKHIEVIICKGKK